MSTTKPQSLPPGTPSSFGGFKVERLLGTGAYGYVFSVVTGDDEFALKWLKPDPPTNGEIRMKNEVWALHSLHHPSIPSLIPGGEGTELGRPYYVMSLARGETLEALINQQKQQGGWFSELQIINLLVLILDAVAHMHDRAIYHRDIKHNNIMADISLNRVWLIDVGCCDGKDRPYSADTFWNIGASRFSPPSKLQHPKDTKPNHDTFAVGVVAYLLVTQAYPWSVSHDEDIGHLRDVMERQPPLPIEHYNNTYSRDLVDFVGKLLSTDDSLRPEISAALVEAKELQSLFSSRKSPQTSAAKGYTLPRVIRDPLHGDIRMTDFEWQVLGSSEFQRLRWFKQLGFSNLVYPGAEHTRFGHSLGSMHVADKILRGMQEIYGTITGTASGDNELRLLARTYALVHDVTHICYGHTIEDELGIFKRHDANVDRITRLILSPKSSLGELLRSTDYGRQALYHFDPQASIKKRAFVEDLVASAGGADVIDYINRDAFYCGLDERIDSAIYRRFAFEPSEDGGRLLSQSFGKHGRRLDVNFALENLRMARFALFMKVYTHPVKAAADAMLGKALVEARVSKGAGKQFAEEKVELMGDVELLLRLKAATPDICKKMAARLIGRQLYKPVFRSRVLRPDEVSIDQYNHSRARLKENGLFSPEPRRELERKLAAKCGMEPGEVALYCAPSAPGYSKAIFRIAKSPTKSGTHEVLELELLKRHASLWSLFVFAPPDAPLSKAQKLVEAVQEHFSLQNELNILAIQRNLQLWTL